MQIVLPLLAFPWLGRVLGPDSFGLLMSMCLIPPLTAMLMDWGLPLGGSRKAARLRGESGSLARLLGDALAAKMLLAAGICLLCALSVPLVPHALEYPGAYCLALGAGLARGSSPVWFYQGAGLDMRPMALWDVGASLAALALIMIFIHSPDSWPLYLLFLAACKGLAYFWLTLRLWQAYPARPDFRGGIRMLRETGALFVSSFSTLACANGAQLVLSHFLPAAQTGIIVASGKMTRALVAILNPLSQTLFPEICASRQFAAASRLAALSLAFSFCFTTLASALVWLLAPWILKISLGPDYAWGAPALRLMVLAAPLLASDYILANQILVPFGREKDLARILALAALASLPLAAFSASLWGMNGGAALAAFLELLIFLSLLRVWRKLGRDAPHA